MQLFKRDKISFNFLYLPLIGEKIEIVESLVPTYLGTQGTILFESSNFFILDVNSVEKKFKKSLFKFKINLGSEDYLIDSTIFQGTTLPIRLKKMK